MLASWSGKRVAGHQPEISVARCHPAATSPIGCSVGHKPEIGVARCHGESLEWFRPRSLWSCRSLRSSTRHGPECKTQENGLQGRRVFAHPSPHAARPRRSARSSVRSSVPPVMTETAMQLRDAPGCPPGEGGARFGMSETPMRLPFRPHHVSTSGVLGRRRPPADPAPTPGGLDFGQKTEGSYPPSIGAPLVHKRLATHRELGGPQWLSRSRASFGRRPPRWPHPAHTREHRSHRHNPG